MRRIPLSIEYKVYKFTNHFVTELFEWACANPKTINNEKLPDTISAPRLKKIAKHFPRVRKEMSIISHLDRVNYIFSTYRYYRKHYPEIMKGSKKPVLFNENTTTALHDAFFYFYDKLLDNEFFWEVYNPGSTFITKAGFRTSIKSSIKICPYCDISLITRTDTNIDHFLPISKFPLLGIFWANLVVACVNCNGNLNKKDRYRLPVLHPYFDEVHESVKFDFNHNEQTVRLYARNKPTMVARSKGRGRNYIWLLKLDERHEDSWPTIRETRENLYNAIKGIFHTSKSDRKRYIDIINFYAANKIQPNFGQTSFTKLNLDYCEDRKIKGFDDYNEWFKKEQESREAFFSSIGAHR